jgi:hypothetical protein
MSLLMAVPEGLGTAATDLAGLGSTISSANAAAAARTTGVLAAAEDEVSAAIAAVFSAHGQGFQALGAQAAAFHDQFVQALTAGARSYVSAEAANVAAFMANPAQTIEQNLLNVMNAPKSLNPAATIGLVMGPSGVPIPGPSYVQLADQLYIQLPQNFPGTTYPPPYTNGLFLPNYPVISVPFSVNYPTPLGGFPPLSTSVGQGVFILENAILSNFAAGNVSTVFGWSQSATISGLVMQQLSPTVPKDMLQFLLLGDPNAPNGGLSERYVGLQVPSLGLSFDGATPANVPYPTHVYTLEYDGFADYPRYPIDVFSDINAAFGLVETHGIYLSIPATVINNAIPLTQSGAPSSTTYYMIPLNGHDGQFALPYPENLLPMVQPLVGIPVVGKPLADLLNPILTPLVNWGYGDPNFGWSTSPADVPTPIGFLPPLSATMALGPLLVSGTQQGVNAFVSDLQHLPLSSMASAASPSTLLASPMNLLSAMSTAASDPGANLTRVVNAFSSAGASLWTVGFQTVDILNAGVTSVPAYATSLFLANLSNPVDAIGLPIAATVGLYTGGGFVALDLAAQGISAAINDILGLL